MTLSTPSLIQAPSKRTVLKTTTGVLTADGAGVTINRLLGTAAVPILDPFLLLDLFRSDRPQDYIAGFPDHPHRGFETVTYVMAGRVRHEDNKGHAGVIEPGGVQWMTAGRGIVHSEMPEQTDGLLWGFQLWLNLPAAEKMTAPRYQEFDASDIPMERRPSGTTLKVIAGKTSLGTQGPIQPATTDPIYWDVAIAPHQSFSELLPATHHGFLFVYDGDITLHGDASSSTQQIKAGTLAVLDSGDQLDISAGSDGGKFLAIAGKPLQEPVVHGGPFVMNTRAEVFQAQQDYLAGRF